MAEPPKLGDLPPELFPLVASHFPLHCTPQSLLSLGLVNLQISAIVLPLVPWYMILKCENDALKMIERFFTDPALARSVRELHIMCNLSSQSRTAGNPVNVLTGLQDVVNAGLLPSIKFLGVTLLDGWYLDENQKSTHQYVRLRPGFFANLQKKCPRLEGLAMKHISENKKDRWLEESGIYDMKGLLSLALTFLNFDSDLKAFKNLSSLSQSLCTLHISTNVLGFHASHIFSLHFPCLRSLSLENYLTNDTSQAMEFWNQHPCLEFISCTTPSSTWRFFSSEFSTNFLPNLRHLKANFLDVFSIAPILHRLVSLAILKSDNAQVPYLLRAVLPEGLPKLKSLLIAQRPASVSQPNHLESTHWYETENQRLGENLFNSEKISFFDNYYMHSIVRGAPNLEELSVQGHSNCFTALSHFVLVGPSLGELRRLQRICLFGSKTGHMEKDLDIFLRGTRILARTCKNLKTVTDNLALAPPFLNARIRRSDNGEVEDITIGQGFGMQIGNENIAFPL
ncbi:hypothetical protein GALMADRAFT_256642 [Galerina marginata CBS 339.88]|uniref:F-box domain-containing protein n=1 Tax=Galerina marginata (strain CBS 339.88) TaxID=685588 RepID=A0A067SD20_GALM3|nr:hypothetical protein GALMADRAFT_256642 [Galerina marginata CBS 339.88]